MLDTYLDGSVSRISPEAPVPVIHAHSRRTVLGGAANVAANTAALGGSVTLVGLMGDDENARELVKLCAAAGVEVPTVITRPGSSTIVKQRVVAGAQQLLRIDTEEVEPVSAIEAEQLLAWVEQALARASYNVIVLSDYAKGTVTAEIARGVIERAHAHGVPVVVDPKGTDIEKYDGATLIKPNLAEACGFAQLPSHVPAVEVARRLHELATLENIVISLSRDGVGLFPRQGETQLIPSHVVEVSDVSGAGDSMVAVIAAAIGAGFEVSRAVELGNIAAGIACTHFGTAVVTPDELMRFIEQGERRSAHRHVVTDRGVLAEVLAARQRGGAKVVFTNGCFDLIHKGHISLLEEAQAQGDVLVVALNSDESVQRLKGPTRPLQTLRDRLDLMGAIRFVDYVTWFDEDTPLELIRALRPDIIVKGGDYQPDEVVGATEVAERGGHVHIVKYLAGSSTTNLVAKARS